MILLSTSVNKGINKGRSPKKGRDPDHLSSRGGYEQGGHAPIPESGHAHYFLPTVPEEEKPRGMGRGARYTRSRAWLVRGLR
jgi:hypothetical protein